MSDSQTNENSQNTDPYERRMIKVFTDASEDLDLVSSASVQFETPCAHSALRE